MKNLNNNVSLSNQVNQSFEENKIFNNSFNLTNPNYIVIMLESVSADHIGYYGYERSITPNIDSFGEKSFVFTNAYSASSHSDYSQPSFLSSRYCLVNDIRNGFEDYPREFIWDILKRKNYSTAYISSQNDFWADMINYYNFKNLDFYSHSATDGIFDYGIGNAKKDYDEKTVNLSLAYLKNVSEPFFLYINFQATHYPYSYPEGNGLFLPDKDDSIYTHLFYIAPEDYDSNLNRYDNSLFYADKQVGKLLNYLEAESYFNNSVIVLTSDHGETVENIRGHIRHGYGVYEEEVNVPLMIYVPGERGENIDGRVSHIDVVPTILSFGNFSLSAEFQGREMRKDRNIFFVAQNQNYDIGLILEDVKCHFNFLNFEFEVYNLTADPFEKNNLEGVLDEEIFEECKSILWEWHNCQLDYYENEKYLQGELINC
ncbi:MAG: sulfatase [Candidatus Pacearchaeota archaeon]